MQTLVILGHPNSNHSHTQQFFIESVQTLPQVILHQLTEDFDVAEEIALLQQADRVILQFPVYWYAAPSLVKRWIDEVLKPDMPFLKEKELGIVASFGVAKNQFQAGGREKYTPSEMFRPYEMIANYFGMTYLTPFCLFQWMYQSEEEKKRQLVDYQLYLTAPNHYCLLQKGEWFIQHLELVNTKGQLESIISLIKQNNEEIEQLSEMLTDIKQQKNNH